MRLYRDAMHRSPAARDVRSGESASQTRRTSHLSSQVMEEAGVGGGVAAPLAQDLCRDSRTMAERSIKLVVNIAP
jgi:hypothetical protein